MLPASVLPPSPLAARCAHHPEVEALSACSRCGTFTCGACQQMASDQRMYCVRCLAVPPALATRGSRFVANLVDHAVVYGMMLVPFVIAMMLAINTPRPDEEEPNFVMLGVMTLLVFAGFFAGCAVQIYFQVKYGQSVGKRWMKIKVVDLQGQPVSLVSLIFLRNALPGFIGAIVSFFGLIDALFIFGDQHRCVHDHLASTRVVEVDP